MEYFKINLFNLIILLVVFAPLLLLSSELKAAGDSVGKVVYVRGVATAAQATLQDQTDKVRILARNANLYQSDVININKKSFAMIEMIDGTKMTLRPNTRLKLDKYEYTPKKQINQKTTNVSQNSGSANVLLHLLKGGLRSVTGAIGKLTNKSYKIRTTVATIGIRGTEFDARLCEGRCVDSSNAQQASASLTDKKLVGRVAFIRGSLTAQYKKDKSRSLSSGSPLYESDRIVSSVNGYAVLAFSDKSRITLTRNSEFYIREFNYQAEKPVVNKSVIELVRGGLRALTGLIAKSNRSKVKYSAMTVTIGIRGTGFDMMCDGLCRNAVNGKGGMKVNVWKGKVALDLDRGEKLIKEGQQFYIASKQSAAKLLPSKADKIKAPRPDEIKIDHDELFGSDVYEVETHVPGLYVSLYDGFLEVADNKGNIKVIGAGEAIKVTTKDGIKRLSNQPSFHTNDVIPAPDKFDDKFVNFLDFINQDDGFKEFEKCEVR
ncbi:MAG: hypothetical protein DIZ80_07600 [endosymbiont of Galathealinum brachiosum]|uniref:FecR protein domain-containing protein n=1 Tax=endosymbiont of Galathealinum brachiosum TaxID=2200906 RepID=A0A370DHH7_9GAMM|nr:MAG: hypothetical protein DIZ80_07600 [endosymbiont of Galathealinum brachiosum]